jgi:hypothetical protein
MAVCWPQLTQLLSICAINYWQRKRERRPDAIVARFGLNRTALKFHQVLAHREPQTGSGFLIT